jgi:hypothetical protein
MLNLKAKNTFYQFDEHSMCIVPSDQSWSRRGPWKRFWDWAFRRPWVPTRSNKSWRDSIGRTVLCWIAYGGPEELKEAVNNCIVFGDPWNLLRHPNHLEEFASRDHFSYWIILQKLTDSSYGFNTTVDCLPRMCGMNLWMKSLTGNKYSEWWYYFFAIPGAYIGNAWLGFCRWAGRISPEFTNHGWLLIGNTYLHNLTARQKLWGWIILNTIPAYALHIKAWQLYVLPASRKKERLKRILLRRVGKSNLLLRLLFEDRKAPNLGGNVTWEEIDNYPFLTNYRPGVYLDESCRRDIREMTIEEAEWNTYEKDLIKYLYNENR